MSRPAQTLVSIRAGVVISLLSFVLPWSSVQGALTAHDPSPLTAFEMGAGPGVVTRNGVASDGDRFYVLWHRGDTLYLSRFDRSGAILDAAGIELADGVAEGSSSIIRQGSGLLIAWADDESFRVSILRRDGTLVSPGGRFVAARRTGPQSSAETALAFNGLRAMIGWSEHEACCSSRLGAILLDPQGEVVMDLGVISGNGLAPRIASSGERFLLVWTSTRAEGASTEGLLFDGNGVLAPSRFSEPTSSVETRADVRWSGKDFFIGYSTGRSVRMAVVTTSGKRVRDTLVSPEGDDVLDVGITPRTTDQFIVWSRRVSSGGTQKTYLTSGPVAPDGRVPTGPRVAYTSSRGGHRSLGFASNGSDLFSSWSFVPEGEAATQARASLVGRDGRAIRPFGDTASPGAIAQRAPTGAFDGMNHVVIWYEKGRVEQQVPLHATRVAESGDVIETDPVVVTPDAGHVSRLATGWNGSETLVVWVEALETSAPADVYGTLLSSDLEVVVPRFSVARIPVESRGVSRNALGVIWTGSSFVVLAGDRLYRVLPGGLVLDPSGVAIPTGGRKIRDARIAGDPDGAVVVWRSDEIGLPGCETCYVARVSPLEDDGGPTGVTRVLTSFGFGEVAGRGGRFLMTWDLFGGVSGLRFTREGRRLDPESGFIVATGPTGDPAVVAGDPGWTVFWKRAEGTGSVEIRIRRIALDGTPHESDGGEGFAVGESVGDILVTTSRGWIMTVSQGPDGRLLYRHLEVRPDRKRGASRN